MAKPVKKPLVKAVVGASKKSKSKTSKGLNSRAILFAVVGVLAFSIALGIGWQQWQDHHLKANAAGWTTVQSLSNGYTGSYTGTFYSASFTTTAAATYRMCANVKTSKGSATATSAIANAVAHSTIGTSSKTICSGSIYLYAKTKGSGHIDVSGSTKFNVTSPVLQKYVSAH